MNISPSSWARLVGVSSSSANSSSVEALGSGETPGGNSNSASVGATPASCAMRSSGLVTIGVTPSG